jgi:hypothetical protein
MIAFKKETQTARWRIPAGLRLGGHAGRNPHLPAVGWRTRITPPRVTGKSLREGEWPDVARRSKPAARTARFARGLW